MTKRNTITSMLLAGSLMVAGGSAFAQDDPKGISKEALKNAEATFQEVCKDDGDNSALECFCVAKVLKDELPTKHYNLLMDLVAHGVADERGEIDMDDEDLEEILDAHDAGFLTLVSFAFQIVSAADDLDKCDLEDNGIQIQL